MRHISGTCILSARFAGLIPHPPDFLGGSGPFTMVCGSNSVVLVHLTVKTRDGIAVHLEMKHVY